MMDTIVPVMGQVETALLAISTALDDANHYTALTKLIDKETNEPLFNVIRIGQVCEACSKTSSPWLCNHMAYSVPPWKSQKRLKRMEYIYEGQEFRNLRENMGVVAGSGRQAFNQKLIDKFVNAPKYKVIRKPNIIFIGADPGGGGPSDLAMTAMMNVDGCWIVLFFIENAQTFRLGEWRLRWRRPYTFCFFPFRYYLPILSALERVNQSATRRSNLAQTLALLCRHLKSQDTVSRVWKISVANNDEKGQISPFCLRVL